MAEYNISEMAGQVDPQENCHGVCLGLRCGHNLVDRAGGYFSGHNIQGIWIMSPDITLLLRVWSFQFLLSMGAVLSVAIALTIGVLLTHWIYLCARNIESKPTSLSFPKTILRLSGFQALVAGVVLVPFITIGLFYILIDFVWKLLPTLPSSPPVNAPPIDAPPLISDSASADEWFSSMASLIIYLAALTTFIGGTIFILLHRYAKRIVSEKGPIGFTKKVVRRYFHESILVGFLLILIACPVILFFFYNMAWLVMYIFPSTEHKLSKIAFSSAEHLYFRSLEIIGSWLIVIMFLPAFWLLFRGLRLRFRYTIENPTMKVIFKRSVKLFSLGLFGYIGCAIMQLLASSFFQVIAQTAFR